MDKTSIKELEKLLFEIIEKPGVAVSAMSGIVGVLIDLKPTTVVSISEKEYQQLGADRFTELAGQLGLKVLSTNHAVSSSGGEKIAEDLYISKDIELAKKLHALFVKMWETINDKGEIVDLAVWKEATKSIGELLGYPETAVDEFIREPDSIDDQERINRMARNRYYAHSAEHEEEEYETYDRKLNEAISRLSPKTAEYCMAEKNKRWL